MSASDQVRPAASANGESRFPETCWTRVRKARNALDPAAARQAFERLCGEYWSPLYAYARAIRLAPEEAQRLVNELFYRMTYELFASHHPAAELPDIPCDQRPIGKQREAATGADTPLLERAEGYHEHNRARHGAGAGRLRDFLMLQLKTIAHSDWRTSKRRAQDGDVFSVADAATIEHELSDELQAAQVAGSPEQVFLRRWRRTLIQRGRQALRREMEEQGELRRFQVLWPLVDREETAGCTSQRAAEMLGMSAGGVRVAVARLKDRLRDHILRQIAETVDSDDPEVLAEEVRALFSAGSSNPAAKP
jgi:RNA polymerase sigma-70 factor (ECF subfamily)